MYILKNHIIIYETEESTNTAKKNGRLLPICLKQNYLTGTMKREKNLTHGSGNFLYEIPDLITLYCTLSLSTIPILILLNDVDVELLEKQYLNDFII